MVDLLNNKLYTKYYPLMTEEDKNNFLNINHMEIYKAVNRICNYAEIELFERKDKYFSEMKPEISFLGSPQYRNIEHNRMIVRKMSMDKHILAIQDKTLELDLLVHKITFHEDEEITIQELNYILELMNKREHEAWITMIGCVLLLILIMFGFYYLIV